jgi:formate dehydrogenase gamma subunit
MTSSNTETVTRFDLSQRLQHICLITSFTMLALTGLPQSFARMGWARAWMALFGGIEGIRKVHHFFAVLMVFVFFYHIITVIGDLLSRRSRRAMLPGRKDLLDAAQTVSYLLGKAPQPPQYDRFDFRQKLEYWALIWGTVMMAVTGLVLMFPVQVAMLVPGVVIYAAKAAHGLEAMLAVASIIAWHMYNTHLAQGLFPLDTTIFTGKISLERLQSEHPLEYQRMLASETAAETVAEANNPAPPNGEKRGRPRLHLPGLKNTKNLSEK